MAESTTPRPTHAVPLVRKRALLIKLGAIGDVIMAIPAAAALHAAGYVVDWVASTTVAPLLARYPWLHVIAAEEGSLLRGSGVQRTRSMLQLWKVLRRREREGGRYDLAVTLYYDRRYGLLSLPVRASRRISLSRTDRQSALLPGRHHTDEYARILLGWPDQVRPTQLEPVPLPELPLSPLPPPAARPRVILVPAGARNALRDDVLRRWPVELYVQLAALLLQHGCEVVLVGGPDDRWASPYFEALRSSVSNPKEPGASAELIDRIAADDLLTTLALMDSATVTVTHDTGPLHMAGLTATALIGIFGPTDPHGRLPQRANAVAFWGGAGFACRPCYDGRDYAPCPENACMAQISPKLVLAETMLLISGRYEGRSLPPTVKEATVKPLVRIGSAH